MQRYRRRSQRSLRRDRQILRETNAYEDNKIVSLEVIGGCHGNLQGIASLVKGMDIDEAIARLEGINCHGRGTSCPDQFSKALKEIKALN